MSKALYICCAVSPLSSLTKRWPVFAGRSFVLLLCSSFISANSFAVDVSVDERIKRIEQRLDNQNLIQMLNTLQSLQKEVSELRGGVEVLNFELEKLKKQQKDIYIDLDQRIQQTDKSLANLQTAPPVMGLTSVDGGADAAAGVPGAIDAQGADAAQGTLGEQESYQAALSILKSGRYEEAIQAYQIFLITYPESSFASNAQYWMAEAYYVLKDFQSAITQFQKVISAYPDSRKVSDAYLKIGFAYYELKEWASAQSALEKVMTDYSDSTAARLAQSRIQKMKLDGNI